MKFCFQTSAYDVSRLLPEVTDALDKRMEAEGRKRLPGLWKAIDRQREGKTSVKVNEMTRGRRIYRRVVGTLLLLVGLFLVIPGLAAPDKLFGPLLAGLFAVGTAVYYLYSTRKNKVTAAQKQAQRLLEAIAKAPPQQVVFSDAGMLLRDGETVSYEAITFCAETPSGVLLNWADKATFLQKQDLAEGEWTDFAAWMREKRQR